MDLKEIETAFQEFLATKATLDIKDLPSLVTNVERLHSNLLKLTSKMEPLNKARNSINAMALDEPTKGNIWEVYQKFYAEISRVADAIDVLYSYIKLPTEPTKIQLPLILRSRLPSTTVKGLSSAQKRKINIEKFFPYLMGLSCLPCIVLVVITGLVSYWSVVAAVASCVLPLATVTYRVYTSMMLGKAVTTMHAQMCKHIQELAKSAIPAKSG